MNSSLTDSTDRVKQQAVVSTSGEAASVVQSLPDVEIQVVDCATLTDEIVDAWKRLRADQPQRETPYFAIEFTQAVAAIREDARIAIFRNAAGQIKRYCRFKKLRQRWLNQSEGV